MSDMLVKLYDLPEVTGPISALNDQGIIIRPAMPYEKQELVEWVRHAFGSAWASECDVAFRNQPVSCFIATIAGEIIGFACYNSTCKGFFGPTAVLEEHRGRGIGKALLLASLQAMLAAGYAYAIIGAVGPSDFYSKTVGATIIENSTPGIYTDLLKKS
jgi:predicted N-acetyltransferase YhbS